MQDSIDARINVNGFPSFDTPPKTLEWWALLFEVEKQTIQEWVEKHKISHKRYGKTWMVLPRDMWDCVPYANGEPPTSTAPKRKRA